MEFDESNYLLANPDVACAVRSGQVLSGKEHFERFGRSEARPLQTVKESSRTDKVFCLIDKGGRGIEIGPSHNPVAPKSLGYNVSIIDYLTADELREKYKIHCVDLNKIEEVDYVWKGEALPDLVGETHGFDWIISSHVIEHIPDLISHLQQCEKLLKPRGHLSLVVPDKRYCFDFFNELTTTGDLLDAYAEKRYKPSSGQIFDYFANAANRGDSIAWADDHLGGANRLVHTFDQAKTEWFRSVEESDYIDAHCWRFTLPSFTLIISDLFRLDLINFGIKACFDTTGCEFYVTLGLQPRPCPAPPGAADRLSALLKIKEGFSN